MSTPNLDLDWRLRLAALEAIRRMTGRTGGVFSREQLTAGFDFEGKRIPLALRARGIWKPALLGANGTALSITTASVRRGVPPRYDDQIASDDDWFEYREWLQGLAVPLEPGLTRRGRSNYSYYMKPTELKVARIGNSRGIRIPVRTLERYRIGATVVMEERSDGILLRPAGPASPKLSWEETAREMAAQAEDWTAWEITVADRLEEAPWEPAKPGRVAERGSQYRRGSRRKR